MVTSRVQSVASIDIIINGHRVEGLANEDPPYDWDQDEATARERGRDGTLYADGMPSLGGMLTVRVFPSSRTAQWAMQQEQLRKDNIRGGRPQIDYSGTISDPVFGVSYRFEGGVIVEFPAMAIPGQTYEFSLDFEIATSLVDGGAFTPPISRA